MMCNSISYLRTASVSFPVTITAPPWPTELPRDASRRATGPPGAQIMYRSPPWPPFPPVPKKAPDIPPTPPIPGRKMMLLPFPPSPPSPAVAIRSPAPSDPSLPTISIVPPFSPVDVFAGSVCTIRLRRPCSGLRTTSPKALSRATTPPTLRIVRSPALRVAAPSTTTFPARTMSPPVPLTRVRLFLPSPVTILRL